MVSCCIPMCRSTNKAGDSTLSFHRIPSDPLKREEWIEMIKQECDFEPSRNGFLCSLHFTKRCFINGGTGIVKRLSKGAYPTLCLAKQNNKIKAKRKIKEENEKVQTDEYSSAENDLQNEEEEFNPGIKIENTYEDPEFSGSPTCNDKHTQTMWFMDYDGDNAVNIYNAHLCTLDINRINCSPFIKHLLLKTKSEIIENRRKIKALHMHKFRSQKRIQRLELLVKNLRAANNCSKVTRPRSSCSTMADDSNTQSDFSSSSSPKVVPSYLLDNIVDYDVCDGY